MPTLLVRWRSLMAIFDDVDNDEEEEDDEECLKKLRQKVCMHVYSMWD